MITWSLIYLSVPCDNEMHESIYAQQKWQCCNGCIVLTQWGSSNSMINKFRLRMFQLEMESMSVVASTKAGERLNLTVFRITFSFLSHPPCYCLNECKRRDTVLVLFFHNSLPPNSHLGDCFNRFYLGAFKLNIHICKQSFYFYGTKCFSLSHSPDYHKDFIDAIAIMSLISMHFSFVS